MFSGGGKMKSAGKSIRLCRTVFRKNRSGAALVIAMIFVLVFSVLAVSMAALSGGNVQLADNQHKVDSALTAAQSGLEIGKYLVNGYSKSSSTKKTADYVTQGDRNETWVNFGNYLNLPSNTVAGKPWIDTGTDLISSPINFGSNGEKFQVKYHYDGNEITLESTGVVPTSDGYVTKKASVGTKIDRNSEVLKYAIASKSRVWVTGNSTIHGNIYSSWQYQNISPFNMTSDSTVEGTINTILTKGTTAGHYDDLYAGSSLMSYHLETLDASGNPVYDAQGNKVISSTDEIQGKYDGINYNVNYGDKAANMPGMKISDYDTSGYKARTSAPADDKTVYNYQKDSYGNYIKDSQGNYVPTTVTEYFPNKVDTSGNPLYGQPSSSGSMKLTRYVCQNKMLTNFQVGVNKNALFQNCTFNGILYVDNASGSNDVRFENCTFNGPIVTTPSTDTSSRWWQKNQLYFTGTETFQNQTDVPATILAPNYNVNIGNTNPTNHDNNNNVLTGAIVGGIVDIRGNAQVNGTIISMYDTSGYPSGYVSNIGATTKDGGTETVAVAVGDIGTIDITPNPNQLLPSGVMSPIVIEPLQDTYSEGNTADSV